VLAGEVREHLLPQLCGLRAALVALLDTGLLSRLRCTPRLRHLLGAEAVLAAPVGRPSV
jgi:hypothetical protein